MLCKNRLQVVWLWFFTAWLMAGLGGSAIAGLSSRYLDRSGSWHRSDEGRRVADNIVGWQSTQGGWPKGLDTAGMPFNGDRDEVRGTFDNGATTGELRFLARAYSRTQEERYKRAFLKGFSHVLEAQYDSGGWPQYYPPGKGYPRRITFNDNAMVNLLELLRSVSAEADYRFLKQEQRRSAKAAFDRGIRCILRCQIVVDGRRTAWCAQHDEVDFRPRPGRSYELVSLSGSESARILLLLMSIEQPGQAIEEAIHAGAAWFRAVKIEGIRVEDRDGDRFVVDDEDTDPLWARFYDIPTMRPIFCGRDGVKKFSLSEIEQERRVNYRWYGSWGREVARAYQRWCDERATQVSE